MARELPLSQDLRGECKRRHWVTQVSTDRNRGKAIAIRLAEDGFDVCINDVAANQAGIDEVEQMLFQSSKLHLESNMSLRLSKKSRPSADSHTAMLRTFQSSLKSKL